MYKGWSASLVCKLKALLITISRATGCVNLQDKHNNSKKSARFANAVGYSLLSTALAAVYVLASHGLVCCALTFGMVVD